MSTTANRYRISLKALLVLMSVISVALYFVFSKAYKFPYHASTNGLSIRFENANMANAAAGKRFLAKLNPDVLVEIEIIESPEWFEDETKRGLWLAISCNERRSLPSKVKDPTSRIPMTQKDFTQAFENEINSQLGVKGSRVDGLDRFEFRRNTE